MKKKTKKLVDIESYIILTSDFTETAPGKYFAVPLRHKLDSHACETALQPF
jgi:hypothetical protein